MTKPRLLPSEKLQDDGNPITVSVWNGRRFLRDPLLRALRKHHQIHSHGKPKRVEYNVGA